MKNVTKIYVGVDVSKDFLDIAFYPTKQHFRVSNDEVGITKIIKELSLQEVVRITCESSGGYERLMIKTLRNAGYKIELVDPKLVKYFILSKKIKAKTDKIDAYMIAFYTSCNEPKYVQHIKSDKDEEIRDLVRMRHNFTEDIAREKKRLKQVTTQISKDLINNHILHLETQISVVDNKIKDVIKNNEEWTKKFNILKSIPGIGNITASALIAEMSELGTIENKQAAALLGVAPYTKQSGNYEGKSMISGGRFIIRKIVYMGALSASHSKGKFGKYYKKLRDKGKKPKVCVVAVMNKIISVANALLKKGEMWNPNFI
jgi:transposase